MKIIRTKEENYLRAVQAAKAYGGECLSSHYINAGTRMRWQCAEGHEWECSFTHVVNNSRWCRKCYGTKRSLHDGLEVSKEYAISHGGICLSIEFVNTKRKLHWQCSEKHEWQSTFDDTVRRNNWCRKCTNNKLRLPDGLDRAKKHALSKKGNCCSTSYLKCDSKLSWQCAKGHTWDASYSKVVNGGRWCARCSRINNRSEERVRMILETYFGFSLPTSRPSWNRNPLTNFCLELDGYSERFNIAFEHDGEHHQGVSRSRQYGHQREIQYRLQIYRDYMKRRNCHQQGVTLINIPIVAERLRDDFFSVLRQVMACSAPHGTILTFSLVQIRAMRQRFYTM